MEIGYRALSLLIGYLLGNFLTAEVVIHVLTGHGADQLGTSHNPGMANVTAHLGVKPGLLVLAGDLGKTGLAMWLAWLLAGPEIGKLAVWYAGLGATLGHDFPFWRHFRGGKGVATTCFTIGICSLLWGILADLLGALVVVLTHSLPVGAMVIPLAFLIPAFALYGPEAGAIVVALGVLTAYSHRTGLRQALSGGGERTDVLGGIRHRSQAARERKRGDKEDR